MPTAKKNSPLQIIFGIVAFIIAFAVAFWLTSNLFGAEIASDDTPAEKLQWKADEGKSLTLLDGDEIVWQFHYDAESQGKPFFHPVALPDGPTVTVNSPADHPWHHGLWFSWKLINGVNYWEASRKTGQSQGKTSWSDVEIKTSDDGTARIAMKLQYTPGSDADAPVVLTENRVVEVSRPADDGTYFFDWVATFTAGDEDLVFNRTPLPGEPGGQAFGGYAGLSVRYSLDLKDRSAVTTEGPDAAEGTDLPDGTVEFNAQSRHRSKASGMDYQGTIDGKPLGVAILDHPKNVNSPSPWYLIASGPMSYSNAAMVCYGPYTLKAGESFTLGYRVIVHEGHWDKQKLNEELERFVK